MNISPALMRQLLYEMVLLRRFEEKSAELYSAGKIRGFLHLYVGEEAVAVGAMHAIQPEDAVFATYREHGHALMRGIPAGAVMAEMFGKQEGCSRGRGGSMHLFDARRRFFGGNAIVAGGLPLALGYALAQKMQKHGGISACFFGEGAVAEGEFHESLNLAKLWQVPALFLCENNLYAMGTALERSQASTDLVAKAASHRVPGDSVDGMDVLAVLEAAQKAAQAVRGGDGPYFLEFRTYRFRAHSMFDPERYRRKEEVERWKQRCPIATFVARMAREGWFAAGEVDAVENRVAGEIEQAVRFAEEGTDESVETLARDVYTADKNLMATTTYREALRAAHREALRRDPRVFVLGEDVGRYGGSYAVTMGLVEEFGEERVRDTPLSESAFVGAGIGAALAGMRPIVEIMTVNFSMLALDQILNNAATLRHMSGGQISVPLVIRMATGAGRQLAAQHSHSLEGWYAHIPGIRVVAPATIADARGMLWTALADPDPVLMFEHAQLYNLEGELAEDAGAVDIDRAAVRREGGDVTLIAYGGSLPKTLCAAEELAGSGIAAEVIDLRTLRPLDDHTIMASVAKTRRAVIVNEGWKSGSLAAEIMARIMEQAFFELDAPVARVCSMEVPIPYARHLEDAALPQPGKIVAAAQGVLHGKV